MSAMRLQYMYGVAVGGRRQLTLRVFIEALDNFFGMILVLIRSSHNSPLLHPSWAQDGDPGQ